MANRFINPWPQFMNGTPTPYADGFLGFYTTGTSTETDTYSDTTLATPNANPVPLDENGQPETSIFLDPTIVYKVILYNSSLVAIKTADPVADPAANVTVAFTIVAGDPNGSVAGSQGSVGGSGASVLWDVVGNLIWVCTTTGTATTAVWTQVGAALSGVLLKTGFITPTTLGANTDNYDPAGNGTASTIRQDLSGNYALYGLVATGAGEIKTIINISSANILTLVDGTVVTSSTAANRFSFGGKSLTLYPWQSVALIYDGVSSRWREEGSHPDLPLPVPGGRLTLTTAVPVLTSDVTAATTVYYTPSEHGFIPLWNGTHWYVMPFSEMSQTLADATKSPAAGAVSTNYDMFVWNDAGTLRCTRGPAWTNGTTRSAGTALVRKGGMYVNNALITNGPAANLGTYVGTISTSASGANGQLNMMFAPAAAAGGTANRLDVWNMYNRVEISSMSRDNTDTWTYTTATWRSMNNNTANRITLVVGLNEDGFDVVAQANFAHSTAGIVAKTGIGLDSTSAISGFPASSAANGNAAKLDSHQSALKTRVGLGSHFLQALEFSEAAGTMNWFGDNGEPLNIQSGIMLSGRM